MARSYTHNWPLSWLRNVDGEGLRESPNLCHNKSWRPCIAPLALTTHCPWTTLSKIGRASASLQVAASANTVKRSGPRWYLLTPYLTQWTFPWLGVVPRSPSSLTTSSFTMLIVTSFRIGVSINGQRHARNFGFSSASTRARRTLFAASSD